MLFLDYVNDLCNSGMSLLQIEKSLIANRLRLFYEIKEKCLKINTFQGSNEVPTFPEIESIDVWYSSPKHHAIAASYLMQFWQKECLYHCQMSQMSLTPGTSWLSCDHTFKSVRNVGTIRQVEGRWIKQYKGLFCVMNAAGQVVTWKLTKNLSFEEVEDVLSNLNQRLRMQGLNLQEFYVDNCCALRSKLQAIFGMNLKVYLDVFHAVQRISRKIPKRHPFYYECLQSLRLVFLNPSDLGSKRTQQTPSIELLRKQILQFLNKWESITYNDKSVLPPAAINEVKSLLTHIQRGCLSGIPPGCGTTHNERLHRDLNSHMANSKYGVELAYALLTSSFYLHNEHIYANIEKRHAKPITAYCIQNKDKHVTVEKFGLVSMHSGQIPTREISGEEHTQMSKVLMKTLSHKEVQDTINRIEDDGCLLSDDTVDFQFSSEDALTLLKKVVSSFCVPVYERYV